MDGKNKFYNGRTRFILRKYLSKYLPKDHYDRPNKSNLSDGIIRNILSNDLTEFNKALIDLHPQLSNIIDQSKLDILLKKLNRRVINEEMH